jgi:hypothetical protein
VCGGRRSAPSLVAVALTILGLFVVLQLGVWMMKGGGVPLLRLRWMKLMSSGSGDHGEDPRPTCHKVSVSSLAAVRFIGSESIIICEGALPDLGMAAVCLFFRRFLGGSGGRWWTTHKFLQGWNFNFTSCEFFCASLLDKHVFVSDGHYICNLSK